MSTMSVVAYAQNTEGSPKTDAAKEPGTEKEQPGIASLDELFAKLARETKETPAKALAQTIMARWNKSGSDTIDLLMDWAGSAMSEKKWGVALDLLDQIIILAPQFAEGWNRRATAYFLNSDYSKSISDVERVLALEPRHFGALSGMASILGKLGDEKRSLIMWRKVLEVYPANKGAQRAVIRLEEKQSGQKT